MIAIPQVVEVEWYISQMDNNKYIDLSLLLLLLVPIVFQSHC